MRAVVAIATVELRRFLRDRSNLFFMFLFPLVLIVLLGSQFGGSGPAGRVAVSGQGSGLRDAIVSRLRADRVDVSFAPADQVRDQLARQRVDVGLFLGADDAKDFDAGRDVAAEIVVAPQTGSQLAVQQVRTAVRGVTTRESQLAALEGAGLSRQEGAADLERAAATGARATVSYADVDAVSQEMSGLGRFDLVAATQTLLFVFLISLSGSSTLIQARRYGVVRRTLAAPLSPAQVVGGEALGRFAIAFVQAAYLMLGTALLFDVRWGSWVVSLLVLAVFCAVAAAAAMVVGAVMDNVGAASGVGVGLGLVLAALGGCMTPLEFFPPTLQQVAHVTPHAWAYEALAEVQRHHGGVLDIVPQLGVLLGMAIALLALGSWLLRRSLARAL